VRLGNWQAWEDGFRIVLPTAFAVSIGAKAVEAGSDKLMAVAIGFASATAWNLQVIVVRRYRTRRERRR
jgi:hypothetical protein